MWNPVGLRAEGKALEEAARLIISPTRSKDGVMPQAVQHAALRHRRNASRTVRDSSGSGDPERNLSGMSPDNRREGVVVVES